MNSYRMAGDLRREQILAAAKSCFARYGFNGTTTKRVAAAASVSEALLFKHFSSKSALYAAILDDACEADPAINWILALEPSTRTLVALVRQMVSHFLATAVAPDERSAQRVRLLMSSQLEDGEFARLLYGKISALIGSLFTTSLERAIAAGDAAKIHGDPLHLFWFAHQTVQMVALTQSSPVPVLPYGAGEIFERQLCEFVLRGIGLSGSAIATHWDMSLRPQAAPSHAAESA